ncbi:MAG: SpoIIE family protein phosphatase [Chloroflexi bacterium]|nr:SpoIIE family protein phosphatase [Chloroflexota bacterium]
MPSTTTFLQSVFSGLSLDAVHTLSEAAKESTYPPGTVLCHEGALEYVFYIVVDGQVKITRRMDDGEERLLAISERGSFFGEMALIDNKPRAATITTLKDTTVLEISEDIFADLLKRNPSVALAMVRKISANLRTSDQAAIADLSKKNVELAKAYADLKAAQAEIIKKERLERELEIAGELQRTLLPVEFPQLPGYSFAARNVPARSVGGDLYDVIRLDDDHVGLLMADVSDKGVHAALFMAVTRTLFLSHARFSLSPLDVVLRVHQGLLEVSATGEMFVTVFYGVLHGPSGRLTFVRCGQDRPLLIHPEGGKLDELDAPGRFLGMLAEIHLEEREVTMRPGDTLIMYSDGVPDAVNRDDRNYGTERLHSLIRERRGQTAADLCGAIFDDVFKFRGDAPAFDDITVLIAKSA